jgi:CheY-like chemotaxis protein
VLRFTVEPCTLDHSFFADKPYRAPAGAYILIAVSDTGTGMPPAVVEHVFEPFFTTKEVGKGTGMGLAATYGTVKAHDGVIEVESTVGEGTTFRVYLPLRRGERESPEKAIAESGAGGAAGVCRSVLLVDDDEMMRETAEDLLRHRGFRVVACRDGHEAVDYLRANPGTVDVVLLDMMMPVMNGEQTFEELRRMQPALPVVLASGYTVEGEAQRLLDQGVSAFIQKPYRAAQLARTIETVLSEAA